ncbi:MAG: hypothetical protein ACUVXA_14715 [Candidatus Jordarchaeum sp.]|uniref:hypothetical protein n=1 Tax=Candidatus Jordarchaeum sp. TaxID=2823881 RepID=UPI00404AF239
MSRKKTKIEISDPETDRKITVTLEGKISPHFVASVVEDIYRKLESGFEVSADSPVSVPYVDLDSLSMREKVELVLLKFFRHGWFTSNDVQEQYTILFKAELPLSTISTYLSRIYEEGSQSILERTGTRKQYRYRLLAEKVKDRIESISKLDYLFT